MIAAPIKRGVLSFVWGDPVLLGPAGGGGKDSAGVAVPVGAGVGPIGASVGGAPAATGKGYSHSQRG